MGLKLVQMLVWWFSVQPNSKINSTALHIKSWFETRHRMWYLVLWTTWPQKSVVYMPVTSPGEGEDWFSIEINRSLCRLCRAGGIECNQLRGQHHHHKQWQKNGNKNGQPRKLIYWITQVIHRVIAKLYLWIIIEINVWINRGDLWWAINWKFSQSFYYLSPPFYTLVILDFSQKCVS